MAWFEASFRDTAPYPPAHQTAVGRKRSSDKGTAHHRVPGILSERIDLIYSPRVCIKESEVLSLADGHENFTCEPKGFGCLTSRQPAGDLREDHVGRSPRLGKVFQPSIHPVQSVGLRHAVKLDVRRILINESNTCGPQISGTAADPSVSRLIREHYGMIGRC
jgi:hypothetical protein